jgi:RHS repeat-associated protein
VTSLVNARADSTVIAPFAYDGAGNRIAATRNGVTTRYIYDPAGNLLATADENNTILSYFVHGQGLLAMVTPDNQTYCYHFDGTGNPVAMTDSSQYSVNSYAYSPFGMIIGENETVDQPFKYVGQFGVMAEPDNLYYMKARYYDADTARFISEDPIGFEGGINLYAYCLNNPILFIDPLGVCSIRNAPGFPKNLFDKITTDIHKFKTPDAFGPNARINVAGEWSFYAMSGVLTAGGLAQEASLALYLNAPKLVPAMDEFVSSALPIGPPTISKIGFWGWVSGELFDTGDW